MNRLSAASVVLLAVFFTGTGLADDKPLSEQAIKSLIQQLVSPNPAPKTKAGDATYPPGYDYDAQRRVRSAWFKLERSSLRAFPYLFDQFDDKRYSLTEDAGPGYYNWSVGDACFDVARTLPNTIVHVHPVNSGYGANQKTCYRLALDAGADIVIMVHPDYQYTPRLIPAMVAMVGSGLYPCVLASRVLGRHAMKGGMPIWKYFFNRCLTLAENFILGTKLSEYHTGYRAYTRQLLERLQFDACSDDFVFDNQVLAQILWLGEIISEVSCPTRYEKESSSINFRRSVVYGLGCLKTAWAYRMARWGLLKSPLFPRNERMKDGG